MGLPLFWVMVTEVYPGQFVPLMLQLVPYQSDGLKRRNGWVAAAGTVNE